MDNWFKTSEQRPPPREGCDDDIYGVSIDVLVWRKGQKRACISSLYYYDNDWLDDESTGPLPKHCLYTHWTYLPSIPTDQTP